MGLRPGQEFGSFLAPLPPEPRIEDLVARALLDLREAVESLRLAVGSPPLPVEIPAIDMSSVAEVLMAMPRPASAPEIALALEDLLPTDRQDEIVSTNTALLKALKEIELGLAKMRKQIVGLAGTTSGGGGTTTVNGTVSLTSDFETILQDIKRSITDRESRLDYDTRTDGNPVYIGKNGNGAAESAADWVVQRLSYDGSDRLTRAQVLIGVWSDRATLGWA